MLHTDSARDALLFILRTLEEVGYDFVTPTPATHARVVARPDRQTARSVRDVFGWSLPFAPGLVEPAVVKALDQAGALERRGELLTSRLRVSRVRDALFLHSAYPTEDPNSVFLGPDTYRFADLIRREAGALATGAQVMDIGAGAGVGAALAGLAHPGVRLTLTDINPDALWLASVNLAFHRLEAELIETDGLAGLDGPFDLILANPPFIVDPDGRAYRDGGDMHGARLSLDWALAGAERLAPGGRMLLYTGSAISDGRDELHAALADRLPSGLSLSYNELDPDIFGEELDHPMYRDIDRIAAIGAVITRPA